MEGNVSHFLYANYTHKKPGEIEMIQERSKQREGGGEVIIYVGGLVRKYRYRELYQGVFRKLGPTSAEGIGALIDTKFNIHVHGFIIFKYSHNGS